MIAQVQEQNNQRLVWLVKGRRKSWQFILQIAIGILAVFVILLKLIGISWWLTILMGLGGTTPFLIVLVTLFRRVFEPDKYFVFDKAWNTFQCKLKAAGDTGKIVLEFPLTTLANIEGNYDDKTNVEEMILEFNSQEQEKNQILLLRGFGENSTLSDREHLRLFL